jgi:hypothetical protein
MSLGADIKQICWQCRLFFAGPGCQWEVERLAGCQSLRERAEVEMAMWIPHQLSMLTVASDISETLKFSEGEIPMVS